MPATIVTLFEHQFRSYAEAGIYPRDPARREKVLLRIEQVNERAGQEILHLGRKGIHANALVGIVRVGDYTFEILPKLDWSPKQAFGAADLHGQSSERLATANLIAMLSYAYDLRLIEQDIAGMGTKRAPWLDLLTRLFAEGLYREIRAGLAQEYVTREETLSALRGRWDVQRQLRQPGQPRAAFNVIYDDLSSDTPLNQVFRYTIEQLRITSQDPGSQSLLAELSAWFQPVTLPAQVTTDILDSILFNRLNERFEPSFHLARMFLTGCTIQMAAGDLPAYAFVFDMNVLFERFIAGFLTHFWRQILPTEWQNCAIVAQAEGTPLYLGRIRGKNMLRLRPDLLFLRKGQPAPLLVADTKYKRLDPSQRGSGTAPEDIYQMLAYAVRLKCPLGLLLYPQTSSTPVRAQIEIDSGNLRLCVATLNLHIPLNQPAGLIEELRSILQSIA